MSQAEDETVIVDLGDALSLVEGASARLRQLDRDLSNLHGRMIAGNAHERAKVTRALLERSDDAALVAAQVQMLAGLVRSEYWAVR